MTSALLYSSIISAIAGPELFVAFVLTVYLALFLGIGIFILVSFFNLCHDVWLLKNKLI